MGRDRATAAEPLTEPSEVQAALEMTRQARVALATAGALPLEALPDVRPILTRCQAEGSVLDGAEMIQLVPVLDAGPRLAAYGRAVREASADVAERAAALPRSGRLSHR